MGRRMPGMAALVAAVVGAGCATEVPMRPQGVVVGNQGGAWEVVLAGGETARILEEGPEYARLDEALNYQPVGPIIGAGAWPEPYRPSLEQVGRLFLPQRENQVLYFRSGYYLPGPRYYGPPFLGPTYFRGGRYVYP